MKAAVQVKVNYVVVFVDFIIEDTVVVIINRNTFPLRNDSSTVVAKEVCIPLNYGYFWD